MRDRLIHAYFDVGLDVVWKTSTVTIPNLIPKAQKVIEDNTN